VVRLIGFFALAVVLASLLGHLPLIGPVFRHGGIFSILIAAALLSYGLTRVGERLISARRLKSELRALEAVGNAYNHGKIGALFLARKRPRKAREHLALAAEGEPGIAEWHYRLGLAELALGDHAAALAALERCLALDEEHAYGAASMRRAECLLALGRPEEALAALEVFERNHGPSPEHAFRRGRALRALGRRADARRAFAEVGELAKRATRYQRREAAWWALRAQLARLG
jgi:tetratricopeptide (TPR) repeat protein